MNQEKFSELDKIAESYHLNANLEDSFIEELCQKYFLDWLVSILDKNDTVLELGYGDGVVTRYLYNYGANITILEGSSILVRKAKNNHPNLDCIHTLFENYNPKKNIMLFWLFIFLSTLIIQYLF